MSSKTHIEWTDATWNPVTGCSKVSQGCKNCYALRDWQRLSANPKTVYYGREFTDVMTHPQRIDQPLRWAKPRRIFVNSMSDLFHDDVPDQFIDQMFAVMAMAKWHTFQVLTKRPERMESYMHDLYSGRMYEIAQTLPDGWNSEGFVGNAMNGFSSGLQNIWLGVSVEDQTTADERIPLLLDTQAAVRWISAEPLLGPIDLTALALLEWRTREAEDSNWPRMRIDALRGHVTGPDDVLDARLAWVVAGGESGLKARPSHPAWFIGLRDQCKAAGVPFLFKQWGEWAPHRAVAGGDEGADLHRGHVQYLQGTEREPDGRFLKGDAAVARIGKKAAGRMLDGVLHDEYPEVA